jgi:anti-anti-sigma regulatory factor
LSESLDFAMGVSKNETLIELRGLLKAEHLPTVREKLFSSIDGTYKTYFINIEQVKFRDENYLTMFLELLNFVKGKNSDLVIIFHNEANRKFFHQFFNVFKIYDSRDAYRKEDSGFWEKLKATGITYQRSMGLRLAPGVAVVFLVLLAGWLLTLFSIISRQDRDIRLREESLSKLQSEYSRSVSALEELKASVGPLKSLGFDIDTSETLPLGAITDWEEFLREKEK